MGGGGGGGTSEAALDPGMRGSGLGARCEGDCGLLDELCGAGGGGGGGGGSLGEGGSP